MTEYVVLRAGPDWEVADRLQAPSAKSAIQQTAKTTGEGEYVAVPARSWRPVTVKVETKTALRFS